MLVCIILYEINMSAASCSLPLEKMFVVVFDNLVMASS